MRLSSVSPSNLNTRFALVFDALIKAQELPKLTLTPSIVLTSRPGNIISDLKSQQPEKIRASILGFESPYAIGFKDAESGFYPDIIMEKDGSIDIISVETTIEKKVSKKDKKRWRLFRIFAKANQGNLYLAGTPHNLSIIKNSMENIPSNLKFIHLV